MSAPVVVSKDEWVLVGEHAKNSYLVRGGLKPICIWVSHIDSAHLIQLLTEANAGIAAMKENKNDQDR